MKYNIKDIGVQGVSVRRHLETAQVRAFLLPAGVELVPDPPAFVDLDLELHRVETGKEQVAVAVRGSIRGEFTVSCARCLAPAVVHAVEEDLRLTFLPRAAGQEPAEQELAEDDLDTYIHDGEQVDIEPLVGEHLLLAIPMTPLCSEDCKGLCSTCGADRNLNPCDCDVQEGAVKAPWVEALARLKAKANTTG